MEKAIKNGRKGFIWILTKHQEIKDYTKVKSIDNKIITLEEKNGIEIIITPEYFKNQKGFWEIYSLTKKENNRVIKKIMIKKLQGKDL